MSNRVSRRQAGRWAAQEQEQYAQEQYAQEQYAPQQYAPQQPPVSDMDTKLAQLKELGQLKEQGVLSDAEFELQKSRILQS